LPFLGWHEGIISAGVQTRYTPLTFLHLLKLIPTHVIGFLILPPTINLDILISLLLTYDTLPIFITWQPVGRLLLLYQAGITTLSQTGRTLNPK
jgi:hypothetical protein